MSVAILLHMLAAVVWVGGMFFAYMALRPAAGALEPPLRLPLWSRTFARFFPWVWAAVALLLLTGYWMVFQVFGGFAHSALYIHLMHGLGWIMALIFFYVYFIPYRRLDRALSVSDWPAAGAQLNRIRRLIGINLMLGLLTVGLASSGAYWLAG